MVTLYYATNIPVELIQPINTLQCSWNANNKIALLLLTLYSLSIIPSTSSNREGWEKLRESLAYNTNCDIMFVNYVLQMQVMSMTNTQATGLPPGLFEYCGIEQWRKVRHITLPAFSKNKLNAVSL